MLVYVYKGNKAPNNDHIWHDPQVWSALCSYDYDLVSKKSYEMPISTILKHVYRSYSTLCQFNNALVDTYGITANFKTKIAFVEKYLQENKDIKESIDIQCRKIYDKLEWWYKRLLTNSNCLDEIKWEVVRLMKFYEKQDIYRISSINLKRNRQDFCYELL